MGTNNPSDWFTSLNILPVNAFDGQIHGGFYQRAMSIPLDEILLLAKGRKLYFVGHSLGGAVAQVCALLCLQKTSDESILKNIFCISFGSPFVGTKSVQEFISAKRGSICLADHFLTIVNEDDCVPGALNIALTVSKTTAMLKQNLQPFNHLLKLLRPAFAAIAASPAMKMVGEGINLLKTIQPDYQPIGLYRFIEFSINSGRDERNLMLSEYYKSKDIYNKITKVSAFTAANIEHHCLWRYEHNLSLILQMDSFRFDNNNAFQLPHLNDMLSALKDYKSLTYQSQLYIEEAIASITCGDITLVIEEVSSKSEFKKIAQILFKLNIRRVICCVSRHSFLIDHFSSIIPKRFQYNQKSFERELSSPIVDYKHVFPLSDEAKEILNKEVVHYSIFSSVIQHKFPNDKESPFLSIDQIEEKWGNELESKYLKRENIIPLKGAIIVISGRIEKAEIIRIKILRRFLTICRVKKERRENAAKVASLSPNLFLMLTTSKPVEIVIKTFGNMEINYKGQAMSISQMSEVIAKEVAENMSTLKVQHDAELASLFQNQQRIIDEIWKSFEWDQTKISHSALRQQQEVLRELKEKLDEIYSWSRWNYLSDCHAELVLNEQEQALIYINEKQQQMLKESHQVHIQKIKELQKHQTFEVEELKGKWETERVAVLKENQLSYVTKAASTGVLVGAITSLIMNIFIESKNFYYNKKPLNKAIYDVLIATAKGALIGGFSSAIVTTIETRAEIFPANSLLRAILKGNGGFILSSTFFTCDILGTIYKYYNKEIGDKQFQASLLTKVAQVGGSFLGRALAASVITNPVLVAPAVMISSLAGNYIGRRAAKYIDEIWIHSEDESLHKAYEVLGIPSKSSIAKVNRAYYRLSLRYHPDKTKDLPEREKNESTGRFIEINLAVTTIRNYHYANLTGNEE